MCGYLLINFVNLPVYFLENTKRKNRVKLNPFKQIEFVVGKFGSIRNSVKQTNKKKTNTEV